MKSINALIEPTDFFGLKVSMVSTIESPYGTSISISIDLPKFFLNLRVLSTNGQCSFENQERSPSL